MLLKNLLSRVAEGEVVPVEYINNRYPADYIGENVQTFQHLTVQDDWEQAGVFWVFDPAIRLQGEYYA